MLYKSTKRKIKLGEIILVLLIIGYILNNIKIIGNILIKLIAFMFIISFICGLLCKLFKKLYYYIKYGKKQYSNKEIEIIIRDMSPREFEVFCANLFNKNEKYLCGKATDFTSDGGKDVIAKTNNFKKVYIECKHYKKDNLVGRPCIQKLIGACIGDEVHKAIFITTSNYTNEALEYAKRINWLQMWTMKDIIKEVNKLEQRKIIYVLNCIKG